MCLNLFTKNVELTTDFQENISFIFSANLLKKRLTAQLKLEIQTVNLLCRAAEIKHYYKTTCSIFKKCSKWDKKEPWYYY